MADEDATSVTDIPDGQLYDTNPKDGYVTKEEIDATLQPKNTKLITLMRASGLLSGPLGKLTTDFIAVGDARQQEEKRKKLYARLGLDENGDPVNGGAATPASATDTAISASGDAPAGLTTGEEGTGYIGIDDYLNSGYILSDTVDGETVYYFQKDGKKPRLIQYKNGDEYGELVNMTPQQRSDWRHAMRMADLLEPSSYVGPPTEEDITAMRDVMAMANRMGLTVNDVLAPRLETVEKYGKYLTEAEIDALDDKTEKRLNRYAARNGVTLSQDFLNDARMKVLNGEATDADLKAQIRDVYVKPLYPQYEQQLDSGLTMSEIASPFISRAQELLESTDISFTSPMIQKALQARDQAGKPTQMALWEFENVVRKDPRWQYTSNALDTVGQTIDSMFSDMGLE